jgi:hypothetical protein
MALRGSAVFTMAALVQGMVLGMIMAAHAAQHDHHPTPHEEHAAIELIVHGHEHESGSPEHQHSLVFAKSSPQHFRRTVPPDPPQIASMAALSSAPKMSRSSHGRTELRGLSPPSLKPTFVVLRI